MKTLTRIFCLILVLASLLTACAKDQPAPSTSTAPTTAPTTKPTEPPEPATPQIADFNRPLPTLPEKMVTDTPAEGDLVLAKDGAAMATIVYPAGNSKATSAADDLLSYLNQITGATFVAMDDAQELPAGTLILVGPTKQTLDMGVEIPTGYPESEKYIIRRTENALLLYGNDDASYKGTQFAVTRFLEEAGCGWYSTEELWQIVPDCPTLAVKDWDQTFTPYFDSRSYGGDASAMGNRWYLGGDNHQIGHSLLWMVGKNFVQSNPEWYPEINGLRPATAGWYQFCYTNESLADFVAQQLIDRFNRNPNQCNYSIAANDGWDEGWCECETCTAAGNQTDQLLVFANRVAEQVAAVHPDKTVSILAYHSTFVPPTKQKAHPNVEVMFCMETNPFTDPSLDWVVHEGFNGMTRVEYTQSWQDSCNQYITDAEIQTAAIWTWFCIGGESPEWANAHWIQGNTATNTMQLYREMGISRVYADCGSEKVWLRWPLFYVHAKSMWDDAPDGETLLYQACKNLYGAAADEMFLLYRSLADCASVCVTDDGLTWIPPLMFNVYGDYINELRVMAENVNAKLDLLTEEQKERVNAHMIGWRCIEMYA